MKERLQKYLAQAGVASRRTAERMITAGRVQVNDEIVTVLGTTIHPKTDVVRVDGKVITQSQASVYLMLNKPKGYITTAQDERGRQTVLDLMTDVSERVYPVGRLDKDTEGLLLLTNDGLLAYGLTHPKYQIPKTYHALIEGQLRKAAISKLRGGLFLDSKKTAPARIRVLKEFGQTSLVEISIHEGRNHQVRRMFSQIGNSVLELKRVKLGSLGLGNLAVGAYRLLSPSEVAELYQLISEA